MVAVTDHDSIRSLLQVGDGKVCGWLGVNNSVIVCTYVTQVFIVANRCIYFLHLLNA
jgi:hypothetical protein